MPHRIPPLQTACENLETSLISWRQALASWHVLTEQARTSRDGAFVAKALEQVSLCEKNIADGELRLAQIREQIGVIRAELDPSS